MLIILCVAYFILANNLVNFKYIEEAKTVVLVAMLISSIITALQHSTLILSVFAIIFCAYKLYEHTKN